MQWVAVRSRSKWQPFRSRFHNCFAKLSRHCKHSWNLATRSQRTSKSTLCNVSVGIKNLQLNALYSDISAIKRDVEALWQQRHKSQTAALWRWTIQTCDKLLKTIFHALGSACGFNCIVCLWIFSAGTNEIIWNLMAWAFPGWRVGKQVNMWQPEYATQKTKNGRESMI